MLERFLVWLFKRLLGRKYWLIPYASNMALGLDDAFKKGFEAFTDPGLFSDIVDGSVPITVEDLEPIRVHGMFCVEVFKGRRCGYRGDRTACIRTIEDCWTPGRFRACSTFLKEDTAPIPEGLSSRNQAKKVGERLRSRGEKRMIFTVFCSGCTHSFEVCEGAPDSVEWKCPVCGTENHERADKHP